MATEKVTENLVKFAYGTKANYDVTKYADYVYFATDKPEMHAQGMWHGVSGVSMSGNTLTITCGTKNNSDGTSTPQTVTVSLAAIACTETQRNNWNTAYNFVQSITGTDTTDVIDHWNEIVDFLAGIEGTTLQAIMNTKANASTKVFGHNGIKIDKTDNSGSVQTGDATLGSSFQVKIDNQCTTGTYPKVTVNAAGLVTAGASLAASDIPALPISKITDLQTQLDAKASQDNLISATYPLSVSGDGKIGNDPTISLLYDGTTLIKGTDNKLKVGTITQSQVSGLSSTLAGYVPTTRQVIAGNGLTGGGALSADRTLSVKAYGNTISVSSSGISVASAPKLSTARLLWGNDFDGSANISGNLIFPADETGVLASHGMYNDTASNKGFIGFTSKLRNTTAGEPGFLGISLGWGDNPESNGASVRINDNTLTYKGNKIYYQGLSDFTNAVNSLISTQLTPIANDFTALTTRVTAVETQLKWIEVS